MTVNYTGLYSIIDTVSYTIIIMTGRGKEGKGLGKGDAKRHRKVLMRDNIQGITKFFHSLALVIFIKTCLAYKGIKVSKF